MRRLLSALALASACLSFLVLAGVSSAAPTHNPKIGFQVQEQAPISGFAEFSDANLGTGITECPQAGINTEPRPLDRREIDAVERLSRRGDDRRTNTEYSCFPDNETAIDTNPVHKQNIVAGQNDYRFGAGSSGFDATSDGGKTWYDNIIPFPSTTISEGNPNGILPSSGDPGVAFDRSGVVFYSQLGASHTNDDNGIFVSRSTNGGFTWSRACVARPTPDETDPPDASVCGGPGDPRRPGDGAVFYTQDDDTVANGSVPFNDKPYLAVGPRPAEVAPRCFAPITKTPIPAGGPGCPNDIIGVDRIYVAWSFFDVFTFDPCPIPELPSPCTLTVSAEIKISYSDDQARSWSPPQSISGSAPFCLGNWVAPDACDVSQFAVPTVHPKTGLLGVSFTNNNTPDENQYLFVRSEDGGNTFEGPFFVTPVFDVNFPRAGAEGGRPDCTNRGQQEGRIVYTNSCFRSNPGGNVIVDPRNGAFADDFYLVMSDNRNGTRASSNSDIFFFKSIDGGSTWIGPTRVNNDPSAQPADRDCDFPDQPACPAEVHTGNDQWWPWIDISTEGDLNVMLKDRRLDTNSVAHEWPGSRQRDGNYLLWTWGAQCRVTSSTATPGEGCTTPTAAEIPQPPEPIDPDGEPFPEQTVFPYRNFKISDVPSNYDYSFRAGLFAGDYDVIAVGVGSRGDDGGGNEVAWAHFTDARNGRSSGGPGGVLDGPPSQPGRNPACEQSDVFYDTFHARNAGSGGRAGNITPFLVTLCPGEATDPGSDKNDD